jgi:hypothetical protein
MDFTAIKKYPSQISTAFRRFPLASALAIFTSIAFIYAAERSNSPFTHRFEHWLLVYPIAATLISLTVSLVQESRQNLSKIPQIAAGAIWLIISIALTLYFPQNSSDPNQIYVGTTYLLIYTTAFLSFFIAPFFKQKNENGFWNFLTRNTKSAVIAIVITYVLNFAISLLLFGFYQLFDIKIPEKIFLYMTIFCTCTIFPILFFSDIPSIDDCLQETPALNKFETSTNRFIFLPVVSLYIALLYAYIVKIIIQWEMPKGMVSFLVSASMLLMLLHVTKTYPERINPKRTLEKALLKILPAACIPLVILMSVGIFRRIADYGISESRYYVVAINIFFYAIIAILLNPKIICKSKYIAIVFCSMFFIATNGPLSAYNVTHRVWMGSIKDVLADLGYTNFPLSKDETVELGQRLQNKSDSKTNIAVSRLEILNSRHDEELAQYITNGESLKLISRNPSTNKNADEPIISKHISNTKDDYFDIPQNATKVNHFFKTIPNEDYVLRNDTLFFKFKAKKIDKTFDFFITKQALEQKDVKTIKTEGAQISVENLDIIIREKPENNNYFHINGILFLE